MTLHHRPRSRTSSPILQLASWRRGGAARPQSFACGSAARASSTRTARTARGSKAPACSNCSSSSSSSNNNNNHQHQQHHHHHHPHRQQQQKQQPTTTNNNQQRQHQQQQQQPNSSNSRNQPQQQQRRRRRRQWRRQWRRRCQRNNVQQCHRSVRLRARYTALARAILLQCACDRADDDDDRVAEWKDEQTNDKAREQTRLKSKKG
jgi:hypothetical protein